jgi:hypothetical protein
MKRKASSQLGGASKKAKLQSRKRARENDNVFQAVKRPRVNPIASRKRKADFQAGPKSKRQSGVGFVTRDGTVVSFKKTGARKAKLAEKLANGTLKCAINPATGRAVREGSRMYKDIMRK